MLKQTNKSPSECGWISLCSFQSTGAPGNTRQSVPYIFPLGSIGEEGTWFPADLEGSLAHLWITRTYYNHCTSTKHMSYAGTKEAWQIFIKTLCLVLCSPSLMKLGWGWKSESLQRSPSSAEPKAASSGSPWLWSRAMLHADLLSSKDKKPYLLMAGPLWGCLDVPSQ